ncbi:copper resistance protein CopC [Streptomyces sp. NPDC092952]|uniref:copper resistance protein CopC n=1 Tax=Streptomyces sp. NPDC092952 TaxID=3366018 RepID=UPI0037FBAEF1
MTATAPHFGPARPHGPAIPAPRRPFAVASLLAVLVGMVLGLLLTGAGPAAAHAALTGSDPQDGAVVTTAPKEVTLSFSEQVALGKDSVRVLAPDGKRADTGAEPRDLTDKSAVRYGVALRTGLADGTYTVAWQAVSADSHPISGAFTFSIGAPSQTDVALPDQEAGGGLVGVLYSIARYAAYAGFILLVGGSAFVLACWQRGAGERPLQRLVVRGWMTLTVSTLAMLLLRNPYTGSGKLADAFDLDGLKAVLDTKPGAALVSRLLLLGASALFIAVLFGTYARREDRREQKDLAFGLAIGGTVVAAGIAGTWALAEHASAGLQPGIAMPVDVLHLLAVAAWLGGLVALLVALHRTDGLDAGAVRRFSAMAFGSVVVLVATGIYQSWRQVGTWSALTGTGYGQLLIAKVVLVAVMVALAWTSRRWTARLGTDRTGDSPDAGDSAGSSDSESSAGSEAPAGESVRESARDVDPERAAQLARQRAAVATAEKKRLRDADPGRSGLRRSVLAEVGVAVVLLAVTTVLTSTEPARTEEEASRASAAASTPVTGGQATMELPFDTGGEKGSGTVRLEITPARTGANELHLWVNDADGKPLDVPEVKVSFTLKSQNLGPLPAVPTRLAKGHWTASAVQIPVPGTWKVAVTVRTSDIDQTTVDKTTKIG